MGDSCRLQTRHEKLWADKLVDFHYLLLLTTEITGMDPPNRNYKPSLNGIPVCSLMTTEELDELRNRSLFNRSGRRSSDGSPQSLFPTSTVPFYALISSRDIYSRHRHVLLFFVRFFVKMFYRLCVLLIPYYVEFTHTCDNQCCAGMGFIPCEWAWNM